MLAWRFTEGPEAEHLQVRAGNVRVGGGILASPSALDALYRGDGTWCAMVELGGEVVQDDLVFRAQRASVVAAFDAADLLERWAVECGCPAGIAHTDPVTAALVWSPFCEDAEYLAASDALGKWLCEAVKGAP